MEELFIWDGVVWMRSGKKAPEKKCYRWVVYVRSPGGVDLSHVIRRVKFQLHPSFPVPERNIDKPPYELEESGELSKNRLVGGNV